MQNLKKSFDHLLSESPSQLILGIIFVFYILAHVQTPAVLAAPIDSSIFGKVIVCAIAVVIFFKTNPVIGVLGFIVAYQIIKTASVTTGTYAKRQYLSSEPNKLAEMQALNSEKIYTKSNQTMSAATNTSGSLETEMVEQMAPLVVRSGSDSTLNYSPILAGQHSAALLSEA